MVDLGDGGYAWVDVQAITPDKQKEFADVKAEVKALWHEQETRKAFLPRPRSSSSGSPPVKQSTRSPPTPAARS